MASDFHADGVGDLGQMLVMGSYTYLIQALTPCREGELYWGTQRLGPVRHRIAPITTTFICIEIGR